MNKIIVKHESAYDYKTRLAAAAISMLALAGCGGGKSTAAPETPSSAPTATFTLTPDMSGFLKDADHCANGGARPCGVLLRDKPALDGRVVTPVNPATGRVEWPLEGYKDQAGTSVTAVCQVKGQLTNDFINSPKTDIWTVVEVPLEHITNPAVKADAESAQPPFGVHKDGDSLSMYAFASNQWFHLGNTVLSQLGMCPPGANPQSYPAAQ